MNPRNRFTRRRSTRGWVALALVAGLAVSALPAATAPPSAYLVAPVAVFQELPDSTHYQPASTTSRRLDWAEFKDKRLAGEVVAAGKGQPGATLHVVNKSGLPRTYVLGVFDSPGIRSAQYVVSGRVRYQKVAKQGYLEMWNVFPDGSQYFTRTLAESGPMARLLGNSNWRDVTLPFDASAGAARPSRLVVQLVLTSSGAVDIGPLELKETSEESK